MLEAGLMALQPGADVIIGLRRRAVFHGRKDVGDLVHGLLLCSKGSFGRPKAVGYPHPIPFPQAGEGARCALHRSLSAFTPLLPLASEGGAKRRMRVGRRPWSTEFILPTPSRGAKPRRNGR